MGLGLPIACQEILDQWARIPWGKHHGRTQRFMVTFHDNVVRIAIGDLGGICQGLRDEQRAMAGIPLSSQRAEGFHRTGNQT